MPSKMPSILIFRKDNRSTTTWTIFLSLIFIFWPPAITSNNTGEEIGFCNHSLKSNDRAMILYSGVKTYSWYDHQVPGSSSSLRNNGDSTQSRQSCRSVWDWSSQNQGQFTWGEMKMIMSINIFKWKTFLEILVEFQSFTNTTYCSLMKYKRKVIL